MITLTRKLKKKTDEQRSTSNLPEPAKRISVRDKLLIREVQEMESNLPPTCQTNFPDPHALYDFYLYVTPDEGYWHGGRFRFHIFVTEEYNMARFGLNFVDISKCPLRPRKIFIIYDHSINGKNICKRPPQVRCLTKLWHPNISEDGDVCLSLLRASSVDGMGWAPTRRLKDVVWGLNSLFTDLLNFDDPLNIPAAEMYLRDREAFRIGVRDYVSLFSER